MTKICRLVLVLPRGVLAIETCRQHIPVYTSKKSTERVTSSAPAHALTLATPPLPSPTPPPPPPSVSRPIIWYNNEKMFDEDKSGKIDEDEFFFLLQYLGIEVGGVVQFCR